jgi:hypothetical protein
MRADNLPHALTQTAQFVFRGALSSCLFIRKLSKLIGALLTPHVSEVRRGIVAPSPATPVQ